jgi:hypothetical protein
VVLRVLLDLLDKGPTGTRETRGHGTDRTDRIHGILDRRGHRIMGTRDLLDIPATGPTGTPDTGPTGTRTDWIHGYWTNGDTGTRVPTGPTEKWVPRVIRARRTDGMDDFCEW